MAAAGLIISSLGTALSFTSLLTGLLSPSGNSDSVTKITVAVAQIDPADYSDSVSGRFDARLYNAYAQGIGPPVIDQYVNEGNTAYTVDYNHDDRHAGQQSPYIKITGNNDAICIAWLTVTWPDGSDWAWTGQNGGSCGKTPWHYNTAIFGSQKNEDGSPIYDGDGNAAMYRPDCAWVDGDGSIGGDTTAFSVYLPHYSNGGNGNHDTARALCNGPNLVTYQNDDGGGLSYYSPPPNINNARNLDGRKRDAPILPDSETSTDFLYNITSAATKNSVGLTRRLFTTHNTKLIKTAFPEHTASRLCSDDFSWGPSVLSTVEDKFCDMSTKTLYDVCNGDVVRDALCFDTETLGLKESKTLFSFDWKQVEEWDPKNARPLKFVSL